MHFAVSEEGGFSQRAIVQILSQKDSWEKEEEEVSDPFWTPRVKSASRGLAPKESGEEEEDPGRDPNQLFLESAKTRPSSHVLGTAQFSSPKEEREESRTVFFGSN